MEELSLSSLGIEALKQGVQFIYAQAGEILRHNRERSDADDLSGAQPASVGPDALGSALTPLEIDDEAFERLAPDIGALRRAIADYAQGVKPVDPEDLALIRLTDALRRCIEAVIRQQLTLKGEHRPPPDTDVAVSIDVDAVAGYVAGIRGSVPPGRVRASIRAGTVYTGGRITGVDGPSAE
jgi:hypothetical protein